MRYFPLFVDMKGQSVLVVGGGEAAAQKVRLIAKTPAAITVLADTPAPELISLAEEGRLTLHRRAFEARDIEGHRLVYAATGDTDADVHVAETATAHNIPVNVVDVQEHCSFLTPSIVDRTPLTIAIGTEGTAPVLARRIRRRIEALLPNRIGDLAIRAGQLRARIAIEIQDGRLRRRLWERLLSGPFASSVLANDDDAADTHLDVEMENIRWEHSASGRVALVGAGPGDPDLLTLKALQALEQADVLVVDRLVSPEILDRARRDAKRIYVGKTPGKPSPRQEDINRILIREAAKGQFVVRLKGGDPLIFARATEEMVAVSRAGIPLEIVPGITAAQGAAASLQLPLTERQRGRAISLLTGTATDDQLDHDWHALARGEDTFAVYMGVRTAGNIRQSLLAAGMSPETHIVIAENATRADQRVLATSLGALADTISAKEISGPAILFFRADWGRSGLKAPAFVEHAADKRDPHTPHYSPSNIELRAG